MLLIFSFFFFCSVLFCTSFLLNSHLDCRQEKTLSTGFTFLIHLSIVVYFYVRLTLASRTHDEKSMFWKWKNLERFFYQIQPCKCMRKHSFAGRITQKSIPLELFCPTFFKLKFCFTSINFMFPLAIACTANHLSPYPLQLFENITNPWPLPTPCNCALFLGSLYLFLLYLFGQQINRKE